MPRRTKVILALALFSLLGVSCLVGTSLPVWWLILAIDPKNTSVSVFQRGDLLVRIVTGAITVLGIVLAFLKDDVWRFINRADLQLSPVHPGWFAEVMPGATSGSKSKAHTQPPSAERYEGLLKLHNPTQTGVKGCEVRLESLILRPRQGPTIDVSTRQRSVVGWFESAESRLDIPPESDARIALFSITPGNRESGDDEAPPTCQFGQVDHPAYDGTMEAVFVVRAENVAAKRVTLSVKWDGGAWEHRGTEMVKVLSVAAAGQIVKTNGGAR